MKKFIHYSILPVILILLYLFSSGFSKHEQLQINLFDNTPSVKSTSDIKPVKDVIREKKNSSTIFKRVNIFSCDQSDNITSGDFVRDAVHLILEKEKLSRLLDSKNENITFEIPVSENEKIELELTKVKVVSDNYTAGELSSNGRRDAAASEGLFYRGIV
jgi:uncharacterized protein (DUF2132 family)